MKSILLAATVLVGFSAAAQAATFESSLHDNTIEIFSSSQKKELCALKLRLSYFETVTNKRETTTFTCNAEVEVGDHLQVCHASNPKLMEPKAEGPVEIRKCVDGK